MTEQETREKQRLIKALSPIGRAYYKRLKERIQNSYVARLVNGNELSLDKAVIDLEFSAERSLSTS